MCKGMISKKLGMEIDQIMITDLTGKRLGGYDLIEKVGAGGLATVYKALQKNLNRWVAVKVLSYKEENSLK